MFNGINDCFLSGFFEFYISSETICTDCVYYSNPTELISHSMYAFMKVIKTLFIDHTTWCIIKTQSSVFKK